MSYEHNGVCRSSRLQNCHEFNIEHVRLPQIVSDVPTSSYVCRRRELNIEHVHLPQTILDMPSSSYVSQHHRLSPPHAEEDEVSESEEPMERPSDASLAHIESLQTSVIPHEDNQPMLGIARRPIKVLDVQPHYLGLFTFRCSSCQALHWQTEMSVSRSANQTFLTCCHHGKVALPLLQLPPPPLYDLYTKNTSSAKAFRQHIVQYNAALAFTSLGVEVDHTVNATPGPPVFRIHGELMHWCGTLLPHDGTPSYAQLYIYDPDEAFQYRMARNNTLDGTTMRALQDMVVAHNPYHRLYCHVYEILVQRHVPDYTARLVTLPGHDSRRNALPTADEVAVILPEVSSTVETSTRDIILTLRRSSEEGSPLSFPLQRISEGHASYAPTHYVLLFPRGEAGWHWDLFQAEGHRKLTLSQYVAFRLHPRGEDLEFSTILRSQRLLHHYIVDMYACIDQSRLLYHRTHQRQYRMANMSGMLDALHPSDDTIGNETSLARRLSSMGQKVLLPNSYIGGPCDMYERYQDGMAIARHYKQMDLFITMTANPNWPEIREGLLPGQSPHDCPDIIARVFHLKHRQFLHAVTDDCIFGKCLAYVFTVEFQKRGLPHCHYLFTLASPFKLLTAGAINSTILASWPNPDDDPVLFDIVKRFMVHGPCGILNPQAPCMKDGKCTKGYPKPFQEETTIDSHGYPRYQRKDDGQRYQVGHHLVGNQWIVPYSGYLLKRFVAHINTECTIYFGCLAYIMKYFKKLRDTGTLQLRNPEDEIERYIQGRYFSAIEAAWHVFGFEIHGQKPSVTRLPIHLPLEEPILYNPSESNDALELRTHLENTPLMAFFQANADTGSLGIEAWKYTYAEFPQHFVLKTRHLPGGGNQKYWDFRQQNFALGRITFVKPCSGERFYLRMLLLQCKGPTSFLSLKEWPPNSGQICSSFFEACAAQGLLEDDNEWRTCLEEASGMKTGAQLRHLFVSLLLFCDVSKPHTLWETFQQSLCSDLYFRLQSTLHIQPSMDQISDYGLHLLDISLQDSGHRLSDFSSMPQSTHSWHISQSNPWIAEQLGFDCQVESMTGASQLSLLNYQQRQAYNTIYDAISQNQPSCFFVNGPAGTGKTFLYESLCHTIRGLGKIAICVASTGVAAILLPKGRTAHSVFKIPISTLTADSTCSISKNSSLADLFRHTQLIIWDECVMTHRWVIEAVDRSLQDLRDDNRIMGGIVTVLGGDWNQCLPVIEQGSREDIVDACLQHSSLWPKIILLKLTTNMRLSSTEQNSFSAWLSSIGDGSCNNSDGQVTLPSCITVFSCEELLHHVYEDIFTLPPPLPSSYFSSRCILAPQNTTVDDINNIVFSHFPGSEMVYPAADTILRDDDKCVLPDIGSDDLRSFNFPNFPPSTLHLKINCPLLLLRNLNPSQGLCNGTRLILIAASDRVLEVRILTGDHAGETAFIPRISLHPHQSSLPFNFKRRQFPVRLCFGMTINKSEGQTFQTVGIDLCTSVFSHGQLYVALSRATSQQGIRILLPLSSRQTVTNVVYPKVLIP